MSYLSALLYLYIDVSMNFNPVFAFFYFSLILKSENLFNRVTSPHFFFSYRVLENLRAGCPSCWNGMLEDQLLFCLLTNLTLILDQNQRITRLLLCLLLSNLEEAAVYASETDFVQVHVNIYEVMKM